MKRCIKTAGHSTEGWIVFITDKKEYFCIDSKDVADKDNLNNDMYSWIVNNLRVFTPAEIAMSSESSIFIKVIFILEGREFIAKKRDLPENYKDKIKFAFQDTSEGGGK